MCFKQPCDGTAKTVFIAYGSKFDCSPQTQGYMNTLSKFHYHNHPGLNGLLLLATLFFSHASGLGPWSSCGDSVGQPSNGCTWL